MSAVTCKWVASHDRLDRERSKHAHIERKRSAKMRAVSCILLFERDRATSTLFETALLIGLCVTWIGVSLLNCTRLGTRR